MVQISSEFPSVSIPECQRFLLTSVIRFSFHRPAILDPKATYDHLNWRPETVIHIVQQTTRCVSLATVRYFATNLAKLISPNNPHRAVVDSLSPTFF